MTEIKLTDEQLKELIELYDSLNEQLYNLGILTFNKTQLETQLNDINIDIKGNIDTVQILTNKEEEIKSKYTEQYGSNYTFDLNEGKIFVNN